MAPKTSAAKKKQNLFASLDDATYGPENSHNVLFLSSLGPLALAAERGLLRRLKQAPTRHQIGHAAAISTGTAGQLPPDFSEAGAALLLESLQRASDEEEDEDKDESDSDLELLDLDDLDLADFDILVELEVCREAGGRPDQAVLPARDEQGKVKLLQWNLAAGASSKSKGTGPEASEARARDLAESLDRRLAALVDLFEDSAVKRACGQGTSC